MDDDFPLIPKGLVEALQKLFPDKCPDLSLSDREVWFRSGQVNVVKFLELRLIDQNEPQKGEEE